MNIAYEWYTNNKKTVLTKINKNFHNPNWIDDWSQDLAVMLFRRGACVKPESVDKYVLMCAYNLAKNYYKRYQKLEARNVYEHNFDIITKENPENIILRKEALGAVAGAVATLNPRRRNVINIFMGEDTGLREMAESNKMHYESFKTHLRLSKLAIKDMLSYDYVESFGEELIEVHDEQD